MPFPGVSKKRERQYENIKASELARGVSLTKAKQIAAATVNKQRKAEQAPITHKKSRGR